MLVISRRAGETIHLGSDIKVTFVRVRGGQVRVAIDAPREVDIRRAELVARSSETGTISDDGAAGYNWAAKIARSPSAPNGLGSDGTWRTRGSRTAPLAAADVSVA